MAPAECQASRCQSRNERVAGRGWCSTTLLVLERHLRFSGTPSGSSPEWSSIARTSLRANSMRRTTQTSGSPSSLGSRPRTRRGAGQPGVEPDGPSARRLTPRSLGRQGREMTFQVIDTIEHRASWTHRYPDIAAKGDGLLVILAASDPPPDTSLIDRAVMVLRPDGGVSEHVVAGVERGASKVPGLFFRGLSAADVPRVPRLAHHENSAAQQAVAAAERQHSARASCAATPWAAPAAPRGRDTLERDLMRTTRG